MVNVCLPVKVRGKYLLTIGPRLKDERLRLGLSQERMASLASVTKQSQINYEKGVRHPDAAYLAAVAKSGADVLYIITGEHSQPITHLEDKMRLTLAIAAVEEGLDAINRTLLPDKKAELILIAYDLMGESDGAHKKVIQFIRTVA
jgi:transcriptional regulator with XRE-family HTH domain